MNYGPEFRAKYRTMAEAARELGVGVDTLRRFIDANNFPTKSRGPHTPVWVEIAKLREQFECNLVQQASGRKKHALDRAYAAGDLDALRRLGKLS